MSRGFWASGARAQKEIECIRGGGLKWTSAATQETVRGMGVRSCKAIRIWVGRPPLTLDSVGQTHFRLVWAGGLPPVSLLPRAGPPSNRPRGAPGYHAVFCFCCPLRSTLKTTYDSQIFS